MQTELLEIEPASLTATWLRAAIRECIAYGEHGDKVEVDEEGTVYCFNCRGRL